MTNLKRFTAGCLAVLLTVIQTACGESKSGKSGENIAMEDLAYGATLRESEDYSIKIEYDKRYLEDAELKVITDYYTAIQQEDPDACSAVVLDFYLQYILENVYGGLFDTDAFVAQQHQDFADYVDGENFTFGYLQVTDCVRQDEAGTGVDFLQTMFDDLQGEGYSAEHLQDCKTLTVQIAISDESTSVLSDEMPLYVVKIDGEYYVCP